MPVDEQGFRADVVVHPGSVVARMNPGQLYEQFINRCSEFVRRKLEKVYPTNPDLAFDLLMDYFGDINPNYRDLVLSVRNTQEERHLLIRECIEDKIYINCPPSLDTMYDDYTYERVMARHLKENPERATEMLAEKGYEPNDILDESQYTENLILKLSQKWGYAESPVTYTIHDEQGIPKTFKTMKNVCIGPRYTYILYKIPSPSSPGVAYVSHYGIPMKGPSSAKMATMAAPTAIREGEDELRILLHDIPSEDMLRFTGLQSASLTAVNKVIEELLVSEHPMNIDRFNISTEEIRNTHAPINLLRHMMATIGVDIVDTCATDADVPDFMRGDYSEEDDIDAEDEIKIRDVLDEKNQ
jgi:hypothetical protein